MSLEQLNPTEIAIAKNDGEQYLNSGLVNHQRHITGAYQPKTVNELTHIVKKCHQDNQAFYVISTGKNWGYGRSTPVYDDNLVIDLSQMNDIHHYDAELGVVEIAPGVTQGQLAQFLSNTPWMLDCTGAGPATSIMGNVLERGFGHGAQGYRSRHFTITEYIQANGEIKSLDTSPRYLGRNSHAAGLTELFTQNNLAVVTKIRFELSKRQHTSLRCVVRLKKSTDIGQYMDIIRRLKAENTLDSLAHIGNHYRMLSMLSQYDFSNWDPKKGVCENERARLEKQHNIKPWTAAFIISGAPTVAKAKAKRIKQALSSIARVNIISMPRLKKINTFLQDIGPLFKFSSRFNQFQQQIAQFTHGMEMFEGNPSSMALAGCYWRNRSTLIDVNHDPIENQCGFYWVAPALPLLGSEINACMEKSEQLFNRFGFEFGATLTSVTPHMCQAIISLYYDTSNKEEQLRAKQLITLLRQCYRDNHWQCYRRAIDEMPFVLVHEADQDALELKQTIKQILDPKNILNPGRYQAQSYAGNNYD